MSQKELEKTDGDSLKWPFYPQYLTQIVPENILSLLLTGIVARLDAPVIMWERRKGEMIPIYPIEQMTRYSDFCNTLSKQIFPNGFILSTQTRRALEKKGVICNKDSSEWATLALDVKTVDDYEDYCPQCHMGLTKCYVTIKVAGYPVAACASGNFLRKGSSEKILQEAKEICSNEEDFTEFKKLIDIIPSKTNEDIKHFKEKFKNETNIINQVVDNFLAKFREEREWKLQSDLGSRFNRIFQEEGATLKEQILPILHEIKIFFRVSFVALFCSARQGEIVLPLFSQVGLNNEEIRDVHFNWKKAKLPMGDDFDSYQWLDNEREKEKFPSFFMETGLKGTGRELLYTGSFFLPYLYGNKYRGIFLLGQFSNDSPKLKIEDGNFLRTIGHLSITRVLALVAINALSERESWRELMTRLWAHGIRSDLNTLMAESYEFEKRLAESLNPKDHERLKLAVERINKTLEEMKIKAKLTMKAPEACISPEIDITELKKEFYPISVLIQNCTEAIIKAAMLSDVYIEVDPIIDNLPSVKVDLRLISEVFRNILDNALKYSKKRKVIRLSGSTCSSELYVRVTIENWGLGIPPEDLSENIFKLGYRSRLVKGEEGVGLGLYQAKRFVDLHGGSIIAESRPAFKGAPIINDYLTTITVTLPTTFLPTTFRSLFEE